jgi:hypothetical protein
LPRRFLGFQEAPPFLNAGSNRFALVAAIRGMAGRPRIPYSLNDLYARI